MLPDHPGRRLSRGERPESPRAALRRRRCQYPPLTPLPGPRSASVHWPTQSVHGTLARL